MKTPGVTIKTTSGALVAKTGEVVPAPAAALKSGSCKTETMGPSKWPEEAMPVLVDVGGESFHGRLLVCYIQNWNANVPYGIAVPPDRIKAAREGRRAWVYEEGAKGIKPGYLSWALWLHNRPL